MNFSRNTATCCHCVSSCSSTELIVVGWRYRETGPLTTCLTHSTESSLPARVELSSRKDRRSEHLAVHHARTSEHLGKHDDLANICKYCVFDNGNTETESYNALALRPCSAVGLVSDSCGVPLLLKGSHQCLCLRTCSFLTASLQFSFRETGQTSARKLHGICGRRTRN